MLIVASSLTFTGGTTFLIRLSKYYSKQGKKLGVLLLENDADPLMLKELNKYSEIYYLENYLKSPLNSFKKIRFLSLFLPTSHKDLKELFYSYGSVHVMGLIGLMFISTKLKALSINLKVSVAIYHQNEFMFRGANTYFTNKIINVFLKINPENILFFNEENKNSYSLFFKRKFDKSLVIPIGIEIQKKSLKLIQKSRSYRIVSIGNLYKFKTYNLHMIDIFPELLKINSNLTYEIYGEGPLDSEILDKITKLGLEKYVFLNKQIKYSNFSSTIKNALLFVGSGTALLEAAAVGVPSLIGVESLNVPKTYGFISDVKGFSYNEKNIDAPMFLIEDKIKSLLNDPDYCKLISEECLEKARTFSVAYTYSGFNRVENNVFELSYNNPEIQSLNLKQIFFSFMFASIKDVLGIDKSFSSRRNQGTLLSHYNDK